MEFPDSSLQKFVKSGLPYLKRLAAENETSVRELLEEYVSIVDLTLETYSKFGFEEAKERIIFSQMKNFRRIPEILDQLALRSKLRRTDWELIRGVSIDLALFSTLVVNHEELTRSVPSFHPFGVQDEDYFRRLFLSIDTDALENLAIVDHYSDIALEKRTRPPVRDEETKEEIVLPVERDILPEEPGEHSSPVDESNRNLGYRLKHKLSLNEYETYEAKTIFGKELSVTFERALIKSFEARDRDVIVTLLKGILTGRGEKSGIKTLYDVGENIIELKAVMNGHKRIFGCLEGNNLRLLMLKDIKESRAAYFRQIPRDLCRDGWASITAVQ